MSRTFTVIRVDATGSKIDLSDEAEALKELDVDIYGADAVTEEEIISVAKEADIILTGSARLTRRVLESLPKLKAIIRYGVGYDTIDVDAATDLGVMLINNPATAWCDEEVSNHAIMLMLACARKVTKVHNLIVDGEWREAQKAFLPAPVILGQVTCIIGCGAIGRMIAKS